MEDKKMTPRDEDVFSVSTYDDDNVKDMLNSDLFRREWTLLGTIPPLTNGKVSSVAEHLILNFYQTDENTTDKEKSTVKHRPIVLKNSDDCQLELLPVYPSILGQYYEYFDRCVATRKGDYLLNVCASRKKSPCIDIPNCVLAAVPSKYTGNLDCFTLKDIGTKTCVVYVPQSIIYDIVCIINEIGIMVLPSLHDGLPYNSIRTRLSNLCTESVIGDDTWSKSPRYLQEFSKYAPCSAVTTATLTVSFVLSTVQGPKSRYHNKKSLELVVHAIK